jgi:hypothetical protein
LEQVIQACLGGRLQEVGLSMPGCTKGKHRSRRCTSTGRNHSNRKGTSGRN